MITITRRSAAAALVAAVACAPRQDRSADVAAIERLMRATWDRPDAPLDVGPVVVDSNHAVADWTQGAMGGRALLARGEGGWAVVLCAGDSIRTAEGLQAVGLPAASAGRLAGALAERERGVAQERLNAMSRFEGIVRMAD